MEERLRSAYKKIEIEFSKQAPQSSLSSNCGYVYERVMIAFDVYLIDHSPLRPFMTTVKSEIALYVYIIDHPLTPPPRFLWPPAVKQATQIDSIDPESQLTGGRPIGKLNVQVHRSSRTNDYLEQIQSVVRAWDHRISDPAPRPWVLSENSSCSHILIPAAFGF